jgi:hypothetical protein
MHCGGNSQLASPGVRVTISNAFLPAGTTHDGSEREKFHFFTLRANDRGTEPPTILIAE